MCMCMYVCGCVCVCVSAWKTLRSLLKPLASFQASGSALVPPEVAEELQVGTMLGDWRATNSDFHIFHSYVSLPEGI